MTGRGSHDRVGEQPGAKGCRPTQAEQVASIHQGKLSANG